MMGWEIAAEAFRAFDRWCAEHDPDGEMDMAEATMVYAQWADTNSIEKYLDSSAAMPKETT